MSDETVPIEAVEVQEVTVEPKAAPEVSKIGSDEFCQELYKLLKVGKPWRTADGLAKRLGVDGLDLAKWMARQPSLVMRSGKEEGVMYFALAEVVAPEKEDKPEPPAKVKRLLDRRLVSEEDRYALAQLHLIYQNLRSVLEKYALKISDRSLEAFTHLIKGKDRLGAGLAVYSHVVQADLTKLPEIK